MNAYICQADKLGVMLFESQDIDRMDRWFHPMYMSKQGTEMNNKVNAMMERTWDGMYGDLSRLSRFPIIIEGSRRSVYDLTFTGTPAKKMLFTLSGSSRTMGTTVRIAYPSAMSRSITKDGEIVDMNQWDKSISMYGEIK